jgi:hypothetical protein
VSKPKDYDYTNDTDIELKINQLKNNGKNYNLDFFKKLLKIVHNKNKIAGLNISIITNNSFELFKNYIINNKFPANLNSVFLNSSFYCHELPDSKKRKMKHMDFFTYLKNIINNTQNNVVKEQFSDKMILEFNDFLKITITQCFKVKITNFLNKFKLNTNVFNLFYNNCFQPYQELNVDFEDTTLKFDNIYNYCSKIKSSIHFMIHQIPNIFMFSTFSQFNKTPQHWNKDLLLNDVAEILKNINEFFNTFNSSNFSNTSPEDAPFYHTYLNQVQSELYGLYEFLNKIPIYSFINNDDKNYFFFIDINTIVLIFQYSWLLVIDTFINIVENRPAIVVQNVENMNKDDLELDEIEFNYSNTDNLYEPYFKKDVGLLIISFIQYFKEINDITGKTYNDIREKVDIMKQKEKKNLATNFLGRLNREELRIQNELKQNKLGVWGENKHFFRYNKAHEAKARQLLDQYIDTDTFDKNNDVIDREHDSSNILDMDDNHPDDNNDLDNPDDNGYNITNEGYNDDEFDDNEYDNNDYSNNDDYDT